MVAQGGNSREGARVEVVQGDDTEPAFEVEKLLVVGTFIMKDHEKIVPTIDTNREVNLVAMFRQDPYIHVTQACRYDGRSLKSL